MSASEVRAQFSQANSYASAANSNAQSFIAALQSTVSGLTTPNLDVDLTWPDAPALPADVSFALDVPGYNFPAAGTDAAPSAPAIPSASGDAPTAPTLPEYTFTAGTDPTRPTDPGELATITLPAEPTSWTPPTPPALLSVNIRPFDGVNDFGDWVEQLRAMPDALSLAAPTPYEPADQSRYASALLEELSAQIRGRLSGGTGLAPEIEAAIWDRARTREDATAQVNYDNILRAVEARGFALPTGAFHAQLREADRQRMAKTSELSRDIAIKQAELEQANVKHAIEQGISLEARLIEYSNNIEQRTFEAARFAAQNAIEIYNALVAQYRVTLERYTSFANVYRTLMEGERSRVEAYRAEVEGERSKVEVNKSLVEQQRAQIEVRNSEIELYKSQLQGVQTLLGVDKLKLEAFGERVKAYVAELNAETVRAEVFKALVSTNQVRADVYKSTVEAWAQRVNADATLARTRAEVYDAQVRGFTALTQRYATAVSAEAEKVRAAVSVAGLQVEIGKAQVEQTQAKAQLQTENYKALISLYESNKSLAVQKAKVLADNYFALKNLVAEASKVAAQVNAQLAASAYGTIQANASIQSSDAMSSSHQIQYGYSYAGKMNADYGVTPVIQMPVFQ